MADEEGDEVDNESGNDTKNGYKIGFCRPPMHARFPKGVSGNPRGRRKGSRGLKTDLDEALKATMTISVAGKKRKGTTQALSIQTLAIKAAAGDLRAQKHLHDLTLTVWGPGDRGGSEEKLSKQDQDLLDRLLQRLEHEDADTESEVDSTAPDVKSDRGQDQPGSEDGHGD